MSLYHMTPIERLPSILATGLKPNMSRCMCGRMMTADRPIWLTPFPHFIFKSQGSRAPTKIVVLKVDTTDLEIRKYILFGRISETEYVSHKIIEPIRLQFFTTFSN